MKFSLSWLRLDSIKANLSQVFHRFPILCIYIWVVVLWFLLFIHWDFSNNTNDFIIRVIFSIIISFFLGLWTYITSESYNLGKKTCGKLQILPMIYWILFYIGFNPSIYTTGSITFFIVTLWGIVAFIFFAPYTQQLISWWGKHSIYYSYFYRVATVFLLSFILWTVLFSLWSIAIATVTALFDISWSYTDELYGDWATFALACFTPLFALTQLPEASSYKKDIFRENTFFSFLIKFACIPAILVYFTILYSYSLKVLLNFSDWPKWEVCWMVIGFSVFWYLVYIFSYTFEKQYSLIAKLRKYFPYVVLPQILMLFYAIYLRIIQYDITVNRYLVVVFGIWLTCISVYLIFSQKKYLWYIPFLICIFTILISVWPWSLYQLPESRQLAKLSSNLEIANILQWSSITPLSSYEDISPELSGEIYSGIQYLCGLNNCESIKELFSKQYEEARMKSLENTNISYLDSIDIPEDYDLTRWQIVDTISGAIKVERLNSYEHNPPYLSIHLEYNISHFPIDISEARYIIKLWEQKKWSISLKYNNETNAIDISENGEIQESINISSHIESLTSKYWDTPDITVRSPKDLIFSLEWENYDVELYVRSLYIENPGYIEDENQRYYHGSRLEGYALIK